MPSTNIASPPQDLVGKSKYRLKNIRKKVKFLTIYPFAPLLKNPSAIFLSDKAMEERGKWDNNLIKSNIQRVTITISTSSPLCPLM